MDETPESTIKLLRIIDECHAILDEGCVLDGGFILQDRIRHALANGEKAANDRVSKMLDRTDAKPMTEAEIDHTLVLVGDIAAKELIAELRKQNASLREVHAAEPAPEYLPWAGASAVVQPVAVPMAELNKLWRRLRIADSELARLRKWLAEELLAAREYASDVPDEVGKQRVAEIEALLVDTPA